MAQRETVTMRDARIIYKNFKGEGRQYNAEGNRNFAIMLGEEDALDLKANGWNVKPMKRREEDADQFYQVPVAVSFDNKPPRVWLVSNLDPETGIGRNRTMLGEGMIGILDDLESVRVDLEISGYDWEVNGNRGRKAYLQSMFFTMYESELEREYADVAQVPAIGDGALKELEAGARQDFDYEGDVV